MEEKASPSSNRSSTYRIKPMEMEDSITGYTFLLLLFFPLFVILDLYYLLIFYLIVKEIITNNILIFVIIKDIKYLKIRGVTKKSLHINITQKINLKFYIIYFYIIYMKISLKFIYLL